jgi:hypothetical protein
MKRFLVALLSHGPFLRCVVLSALVLRTGVSQAVPPTLQRPVEYGSRGYPIPKFATEDERQHMADFATDQATRQAQRALPAQLEIEKQQRLAQYKTYQDLIAAGATPAVAASIAGLNGPVVAVAPVLGHAATSEGATTDNQYKTNDRDNGRFWELMDDAKRASYINGFEAAFSLQGGYKPKQTQFPTGSGTFGDIRKGLDRFYQDPENLSFPIFYALHIFAMKVNGASQAEVEAEVRRLRAVVNTPVVAK